MAYYIPIYCSCWFRRVTQLTSHDDTLNQSRKNHISALFLFEHDQPNGPNHLTSWPYFLESNPIWQRISMIHLNTVYGNFFALWTVANHSIRAIIFPHWSSLSSGNSFPTPVFRSLIDSSFKSAASASISSCANQKTELKRNLAYH